MIGGSYYLDGSVTVGIWAKKAGAWSLVTLQDVYISQAVGGPGQQTAYWDQTWSIDLGPGVQAFGVTKEGTSGTAAVVSKLYSAAWSATASTGERSATPSSQASTVTVRPQ